MALAIVAAAPETLEITAKKVRVVFKEDLEQAAANGTTGPALYGAIMMLKTQLKADTRSNEQFNSLIRILNERARTIHLDLLDARCRIKKALGGGTRGVNMRWSKIRPAATTILEDCIAQYDEGQEQLQMNNIFSAIA